MITRDRLGRFASKGGSSLKASTKERFAKNKVVRDTYSATGKKHSEGRKNLAQSLKQWHKIYGKPP